MRQRIDTLRDSSRNHQRELHEAQNQQQTLSGRLASLRALQQAALGEGEGVVNQWLDSQNLGDAPRLAKQLDVAAGWERAVETALGSNLEAVCIDSVDSVVDALEELQQGKAKRH